MPASISVQLYSLREEMKDGKHAAILRQLGEIGYTGVEGAGFYGLTAKKFRALVNDCGMVVSSNHTSMPTTETVQQCIDLHYELGCDYAISGFWMPDFENADAIKRTADRVAPILEPLRKAGITFALHNHWAEFNRIDGVLVYDLLFKHCPGVRLEIDRALS